MFKLLAAGDAEPAALQINHQSQWEEQSHNTLIQDKKE